MAARAREPVAIDPDDSAAAEATALRILGGAAQSTARLQQRLRRHGFSDRAARDAVERCRERGYVDDAALAQSVTARHRRALHGRVRVVADLRARGVDAGTIAAATQALADTEQDAAVSAATQLWERSVRSGKDDAAAKRRIGAALSRRGFSGDVVVRALRSLS